MYLVTTDTCATRQKTKTNNLLDKIHIPIYSAIVMKQNKSMIHQSEKIVLNLYIC